VRPFSAAWFRGAAKIAEPLVPSGFRARAPTGPQLDFPLIVLAEAPVSHSCRRFCWSGQGVSRSDFDSAARQFSSCSSIPRARADSGRKSSVLAPVDSVLASQRSQAPAALVSYRAVPGFGLRFIQLVLVSTRSHRSSVRPQGPVFTTREH
jgi:hypothetical protein